MVLMTMMPSAWRNEQTTTEWSNRIIRGSSLNKHGLSNECDSSEPFSQHLNEPAKYIWQIDWQNWRFAIYCFLLRCDAFMTQCVRMTRDLNVPKRRTQSWSRKHFSWLPFTEKSSFRWTKICKNFFLSHFSIYYFVDSPFNFCPAAMWQIPGLTEPSPSSALFIRFSLLPASPPKLMLPLASKGLVYYKSVDGFHGRLFNLLIIFCRVRLEASAFYFLSSSSSGAFLPLLWHYIPSISALFILFF